MPLQRVVILLLAKPEGGAVRAVSTVHAELTRQVPGVAPVGDLEQYYQQQRKEREGESAKDLERQLYAKLHSSPDTAAPATPRLQRLPRAISVSSSSLALQDLSAVSCWQSCLAEVWRPSVLCALKTT
jgi:hypothetical protein